MNINVETPLTHEEAYSRLNGIIYIAKNKIDADNYVLNNGGIIFKEKDMEVYRVFPNVFNNYNGQVNIAMEED